MSFKFLVCFNQLIELFEVIVFVLYKRQQLFCVNLMLKIGIRIVFFMGFPENPKDRTEFLDLIGCNLSIEIFHLFFHLQWKARQRFVCAHEVVIRLTYVFWQPCELLKITIHFLYEIFHILIVVFLFVIDRHLHFSLKQAKFFYSLQNLHFLICLELSLHRLVVLDHQKLLQNPGIS